MREWLVRVRDTRFVVPLVVLYRETIDSVKQSAALCLLHLLRTSADAIPMSEWSTRIIHLLNDQHMVSTLFT